MEGEKKTEFEFLEDAFADWAALNAYSLSCGSCGDIFDLRDRLNAASAKALTLSGSAPIAAENSTAVRAILVV